MPNHEIVNQENNNQIVNVTPDPKILLAITGNPMSPIHALCELIDNSIDSFSAAKDSGHPVEVPVIKITLPRRADIEAGIGFLEVEDNGPGLSEEQAINAVRAGFSGNNPFDRLGLFGMGFNISTGKIGANTVFSTCRKQDNKILSININLTRMIREGTYNVPINHRPKVNENQHGTVIRINDWWPNGYQNYGFIQKLLQIGRPKLREQIGRRYSTLLSEGITIFIDEGECPVYNHCVWDSSRYVERRDHGRINARYDINETVSSVRVCRDCFRYVDNHEVRCSNCGSENIFTKENKIKGWVGIQRFDDVDSFGIDLIRNGRVIRVFEKDAFFKWTSATGEEITDYPLDNPYGRIIGEIHIDFVPVDFLKTDFQRTSPEWSTVMKILRGESTLQPRKRIELNEPENDSYIYKLYQGYRSVRNIGRKDLYMGYWDSANNMPKRISRDIEREYYQKFKDNEAGYGPRDDSEWYKLVEQADTRPLEGIKECPECHTQNTEAAESCINCNYVFIGKNCINTECNSLIPISQNICQYCERDQNQGGSGAETWDCQSCQRRNNPSNILDCPNCGCPRGSIDVLNFETLKEKSDKVDYLSNDNIIIPLPGGGIPFSSKLNTFFMKNPHKLERDGIRLPAYLYSETNEINIFIDPTHDAFNAYQDRPEDYISLEISRKIVDLNYPRINNWTRPLWSLSNIYILVLLELWRNRIELDPETTRRDIREFIVRFCEELPQLFREDAGRIYEEFNDREKSIIMQNMISQNIQPSSIQDKINSGEFFKYIPDDLILKIYELKPSVFFDGNFWSNGFNSINIPDPDICHATKEDIIKKYKLCLEDITSYQKVRMPEANHTIKVNQSLRMLKERMVEH